MQPPVVKTVLFLGAGASDFAGCPTTKKLSELTLANIRERFGDPIDGNESNRLKFLEHVVQDAQLDDIEKVYSCANRILASHNQYSRVVLDRMTYGHDGIGTHLPEMLNALRMLKRVIRKTMLDSFDVGSGQKDIAKLYGSLFNAAGGASGGVDIITTNYDNVIETYCNRTGTSLVDGFEPSKNGDHRVWKDSWDVVDGCVRLVKLHGSVTWQRRDGGIIGMMVPGSRGEGEDVLVEPTLDAKDYGDEPLPQLAMQCDAMLSGKDALLVAIGYSFRDDAINEKIIGAIRRGTQMLVVSPDAEDDVKKNLKPNANFTKDIRPRIETMPEEFGRDGIAGLCERIQHMRDGG